MDSYDFAAGQSGPNTGPDYMFGWGLMNTLKAAQAIKLDSSSTGIIIEDYLTNQGTDQYEFYSDGTEPLRFTLAWTDPAGNSPTPSLNPTTPMLVNDLDLRLERIGPGTLYYPYILNPSSPASAASTGDNTLDNVEQIFVDVGNFIIIVDDHHIFLNQFIHDHFIFGQCFLKLLVDFFMAQRNGADFPEQFHGIRRYRPHADRFSFKDIAKNIFISRQNDN